MVAIRSPRDESLSREESEEQATTTLWDVASRRDTTNLGKVYARAFSSDGKWLVTTGSVPKGQPYETAVSLWDVGARKRLFTNVVREFAGAWFSPDGQYLALDTFGIAGKCRIIVWRVPTGEKQYESYDSMFRGFADDGRTLVTCSDDGSNHWDIKFWTLSTRLCCKTIEVDHSYPQPQTFSLFPALDQEHLAVSLRFHTEKSRIAAWLLRNGPKMLGSVISDHDRDEYAIALVNSENVKEVCRFPGCQYYGDLTRDNKLFVGTFEDHRIAVWDVPPQRSIGQFLTISFPVLIVVSAGFWMRSRRRRSAKSLASASTQIPMATNSGVEGSAE